MMARLLTALGLAALTASAAPKKVLFLTHSAGYRHGVVTRPKDGGLSLAEQQLTKAAAAAGFDVTCTQDCGDVSTDSLKRYDAVVFYTTGELPLSGQAVLDYVRRGGAFVGIHPATDTFYKFAGYGRMVGAYFNGHPWHKKVTIRREDKSHPATKHLPDAFELKDEIYQFRDWDRDRVHVLLSLDVESVDTKKKGVRRDDNDFALAWCKRYGSGRVFYTALGHRPEVWNDERFLKHVVGGLQWATSGPVTDAEGFQTLYDGSGTDGWKQAGPGSFRHENGVATAVGGMGLWYYEKTYRNFTLKLEFRQKELMSNSGVFVRFPRVDGDPWHPVKEGHEIQIYGDKPAKGSTGSVYQFATPTKVPLKPAGEWNEYEITCVGPHYRVHLNGELITTYKSDRSLTGMVGIQNHNANGKGEVSFRNIRIRELPDDATDYHVLFDSSGAREHWKMCGPGAFLQKDGVLTSTGGMGMLWHDKPFTNFILMLDWKVGRKQDNAGVFVRFPDPGDDPWVAVKKGYEIQICDTAKAKHRTGSVYSFQDATSVPTFDVGNWNHYEIQVVGQRYTITINGKVVNEYVGSRSAKGHIGLQNHDDKARVSFRNIRVVELK